MTDQPWRNRWREQLKLGLRRGLHRADLDLARDPYVRRVVRTLDHAGIDTVLDVGANVGQYAAMVRAAGYPGRIVSFEPLADAHAQLARRSAKDDGWSAIRSAVGDRPGTATINVSANSYSSSLRPMAERHLRADPDSAVVGTQEVDVTTVADIVVRHDVDPPRTLLKIDTQGFESAVLDGAGDHLAAMAAVQLELSFVELYEGQVLHDALVERMQDAGFVLWSLETGISDQHGRLLQCDGLFVQEALHA